jgi:hypothetical protein
VVLNRKEPYGMGVLEKKKLPVGDRTLAAQIAGRHFTEWHISGDKICLKFLLYPFQLCERKVILTVDHEF